MLDSPLRQFFLLDYKNMNWAYAIFAAFIDRMT